MAISRLYKNFESITKFKTMKYKAVKKLLIKTYHSLNEKQRSIILFFKEKLGEISKVSFADFSDCAEKILVVKDPTEEIIDLPQIYGFIKEGSMVVNFPEVALWKFDNATVFGRSDFVLLNKKTIVWPKRTYYNFSKNLPQDNFIYTYDYNHAYIRKAKREKNVDVAFSLIGVGATIWSHVLCEYLPKLYTIRKVVSKESRRITVLVPEYGEGHIKDIIYNELEKLDVDILIVKNNEAVIANTLYFMERVGRVTDHEVYVEIGDQVEPKLITDLWKEHVSKPLIDKYVENKDKKPELKLYLARRTDGHRMMTNNGEIEKYYQERGYIFVEPHKIPFKDVVNLFYHASIVAGPFSSAFTNLIFSRPGTKAFIMCNYTRAFENFLEPIQQYYDIDINWLLGYDIDKKHPAHSSYYVPMDRMIEACNKYGIC